MTAPRRTHFPSPLASVSLILLIGMGTYPVQAQGCEWCLSWPCQNPIPQADDVVWKTCLNCLQQVYPALCQTVSGCAYNLIERYSNQPNLCCINTANLLLSNLAPQIQDGISAMCNAPPSPSTSRPQIAAAPLPYTSSGQPLQFIMPQMNFSCHGCLQSLNITLMAGVSADASFYFQLWRRYTAINNQTSLTKELYQLNTSVLLTIRAAIISSSNVYSLPLNVCYHEGDTIGIQLPSNSLLRIATDNSSLIYKREIPAQCSDVVSGIFQPSDNYTGSPLVTLIMAPSSPSPTTESQSTASLGPTNTTSLCTVSCFPLTTSAPISSEAIWLGTSLIGTVMVVLLVCSVTVVIGKRRIQTQQRLNEELVFDNRHRGTRSNGNHKTIESYASLYQVNGQLHVYQELSEVPPPACKEVELPTAYENMEQSSASVSCLSQLSSTYSSEPNLSRCNDYSLQHHITASGMLSRDGQVVSLPSITAGLTRSTAEPTSVSNHLRALPPVPTSHSSGLLTHSGIVSDEKHWLINKLIVDQEEGGISSPVPPPERLQTLVGMTQDGYSCLTHSKGTDHGPHDRSITESDMFWNPPSSIVGLYEVLAKKKYREIHQGDLKVVSNLGSGNFGTVFKGVWSFSGGHIEVAIKMLKDGASEEDRVKFLQEAAIMGQFFHPNVVKLYGVVTVGDPLAVISELVPKGNLRNFVLSCKPKESTQCSSPIPIPASLPKTFVAFARDISCGMAYLSKKNFVHRDLAARNIFLTDDLRCKIGDFGMARDLAQGCDNIYQSQGGMIPLKWSAPEAIQYHQYNTFSDVWSFGMVLYEVWSLGHKPFENETSDKLRDLVTTGYCQPPPPGCPRAIYGVMVKCWHPNAAERPSFSELYHHLGKPVEDLLVWSEEDRQCGEQVSELGAPMACSRNLYPDLQNYYTR